MRLTDERNPAINRLSSYFKRIEAIADHLGIEVDDLVKESERGKCTMYTTFKKNFLSQAQNRIRILNQQEKTNLNQVGSSIIGLDILVNKNEKR